MKLLVIKHIACEGPGLLGDYCYKNKIPMDEVSLFKGQRLSAIEEVDGIVVLGGPMNVYEVEQHPWLALEDRFLKQALEKNIPILGFCLGAQLLAKAAGFSVVKNKKREIGYREIVVTKEGGRDPLLKTLAPSRMVFHWHGDRVELPDDGSVSLLAASQDCPVQAFCVPNKKAWGIQFHLEVTPPMAKEWFEEYKEEALQEKIEIEKELRASLNYAEELQNCAEKLFDSFTAFFVKR